MGKVEALLAGQRPPGIYRLRAWVNLEGVQRRAEARGWRVAILQGHRVADKPSFLQEVAAALAFPGYFGANWDAFEECIRDLSWVPAAGHLLLYDRPEAFVRQQPEQWAVARSILEDAVRHWRSEATSMAILLRRAGRSLPDVPWL